MRGWVDDWFQPMQHSCLDYVVPRSHESIEPHGERCHQEWWECPVCQSAYTETEVAQMCIRRAEAELGALSDADSKPLPTKRLVPT